MSSKSARNKVRISVTIIPSLDNMLTKVSKNSGESKSSLIEHAVSKYLKNKFEKDIKTLSKMDFDDLPSEDEWLSIQSNNL